MNEDLTKALHSAAFAKQELQAALSRSTPVEALILLPMIRDAAALWSSISALLGAMES